MPETFPPTALLEHYAEWLGHEVLGHRRLLEGMPAGQNTPRERVELELKWLELMVAETYRRLAGNPPGDSSELDAIRSQINNL
jgi:hypothetical protein